MRYSGSLDRFLATCFARIYFYKTFYRHYFPACFLPWDLSLQDAAMACLGQFVVVTIFRLLGKITGPLPLPFVPARLYQAALSLKNNATVQKPV
jgi:hypothetical protein